MKNKTTIIYFYILAFSDKPKDKTCIASIFFLIYLVGMLMNCSIITVISLDPHLHHPMYLFICNLSFIDILYTTITVPKFIYILLSGNKVISIAECFTQLNFYVVAGLTEDILLLMMAYDRYVAICLPLHYHRILSKRNCTLITIGIWKMGWLSSLLFTLAILNMSTCHSNTIHQFFCDVKSMTMISCKSSGPLYAVMALITLFFAVSPFSCTVLSYIKIFAVILRIKSNDGRRKAFSTCSSHLSVITLFYTSAVLSFLSPSYSDILDFVFIAFFTTIIPIINPNIYSLQNFDVKMTLLRLFCQRQVNHSN